MAPGTRCTFKRSTTGGSGHYVPDPNGTHECRLHKSTIGAQTEYYAPISQDAPRPSPPTRYTQAPKAAPLGAQPCRVVCEFHRGDWVLLAAIFLDVEKFGGLKIFVYEANAWAAVMDRRKIDPHFYPDGKSALLRIRPDAAGLICAAQVMGVDPNGVEMAPFRAVLATVGCGLT